jgi:hypothetical protein
MRKPNKRKAPRNEKLEAQFQNAMDAAKTAVCERYAAKYPVHFRQVLSRFKLHRHEIKIFEGMGSAFLLVNGKQLDINWDRINRDRHDFPIWIALEAIEEELRSADWAYCLGGEILNPKELAEIREEKEKL